ncbi:hypothetical protein [Archangium sp.]|jgi:uncharacterized C2H2 Zn-finger protein|uniref:hypothetical protein n=1 Tax=Archangium sp. TaxID=1872627 RepID=UPI002EDAC8F3
MPVQSGSGRKKRARKNGTPKPAGFAAALALVVQHGRKLAKEVGKTALSRCPRCGHVGPTQQDFGTRIIRGERRPQSWCRSCRKTNLPPLKALTETSGRSLKATRSETANEVSASARSSAKADGWLFPELVPVRKKRRTS